MDAFLFTISYFGLQPQTICFAVWFIYDVRFMYDLDIWSF